MKLHERVKTLEDTLNNLIDQYNIVKAQNLAMNHALAGLFHILPDEIRVAAELQYDLRCAFFQSVVNNGKTTPDQLTIQRTEFANTKARIYPRATS